MTTIRAAGPADAEAFLSIIGGCWDEYPGLPHALAGERPAIAALARSPPPGGAVFVAEAAGDVVGLAATWPTVEPGLWELGRFYLRASDRGAGIATSLLGAAEAAARRDGGTQMRLWSDTRLTRAHRFYEKSSFIRQGALRVLDDGSDSIDFGYEKPLAGVVVRALDLAGADSVVERLARLLVRCVDDGASVSFLAPLPIERARAFWRERAREVAAGSRIMVVAWLDGVIAGVVTLDCDTPQNQPHRADLQKLLVDPDARRHGIGRALMRAAEAVAVTVGRNLLTLDTASDSAESLYREFGWQFAGRIPGYALSPTGVLEETRLFWKRLEAAR